MAAMLAQQHTQTARDFLEAAGREFAEGDVLQASEKMWGAASHAVISVAQARGWQYGTHRSLSQAILRVERELGDLEMRGLFAMAEHFHANVCLSHLEDFQIERYRAGVRRLVHRLLALVE